MVVMDFDVEKWLVGQYDWQMLSDPEARLL
jgi:hypothetical protein